MDKDTINDISAIINEKLEKIHNTARLMANVSLLNHYKNDVKTWRKKQINDVPKLKKDINALIKREIVPIYKAVEVAVLLAYKVADKTFDDLDVNQKQIQINADNMAKRQIRNMKVTISKELNKMPQAIQKYQLGNINQAYSHIMSQPHGKELTNLYEQINEQIDKGIQNAPKFRYKNGREVGFQEHMEMTVRTELQKEAREFQIKNGRENGMIFYLCSHLGDSASDHAPFQGLIYIDEQWESIVSDDLKEQVEEYIAFNKTRTMQDVENNPPYLNSRPNCRHHFEAIDTYEVLHSTTKTLLRTHDMQKGEYDRQNYIDSQKQRYHEREIRKLKNKIAEKDVIWEKTPDAEERKKIEEEVNKLKASIRNQQKEQRELVKSNPNLERNYTREKTDFIMNGLQNTIRVDFKQK